MLGAVTIIATIYLKQVFLKVQRNLRHFFKMAGIQPRGGVRRALVGGQRYLILGQCIGRLKCVTDLPAVPLQVLVVCPRKLPDASFVDLRFRLQVPQMPEVHLPNFCIGTYIQGWVVQADVNPRFKGFVQCSDPIRSQKKDTRVVLKYSEKN